MLTRELDYDLPPDRIATTPAEPRDAAKLMVVWRDRQERPVPLAGGTPQTSADDQSIIEHVHVRDLPTLRHPTTGEPALRPGDVMIFNQSRVVPARFTGTRAGTGGRVTGLYLSSPSAHEWRVMLESRGTLLTGERVDLGHDSSLELIDRLGEGQWRARLTTPPALGTLTLLDRIGSPPLPPYIRQQRRLDHQPEVNDADRERYNTVYARDPGSVAAPTAGLHFTPALLGQLDAMGVRRAAVTLHIGLGTFAPVRSDRLDDHAMHREWFTIPRETLALLHTARHCGGRGRVIAVGTTTVRALESLPNPLPAPDANPAGFSGETDLFIRPADASHAGFQFRFTDALLTNFHLPRSTLLAMVAALPGVGLGRLKSWYATAIAHQYRFYSYGDAMLIL